MSPASPDYRGGYRPPERPDWVRKVNEEGECMNISGVVPLDADSLLYSATAATGLSDFGSDEWREPFEVFLTALENEAQLNLIGRLRTRSEILQLLEARLQIEDTYKRHPEIAEETVSQPLIIIGQGRSGTSLLHNLLGAHPDNGVLRHWELVFPCPPPEADTYQTDPRIERAHKLIDQWNRVVPQWPSIHEMGATVPMEDMVAMGMNFWTPSWMDCLGQVPSYQHYISQRDVEPGLRYLERVLKLLQWRNPREHWILKDPLHLDRMPELLEVFPDAFFIWPHRDPVRAFASLISTAGAIQWGRTDHPFSGIGLEYVTNPELSAGRLANAISQIESGQVPRERVFNPLFVDLVEDPIATIRDMYQQFGLELTDDGVTALQRYMNDNPRDSRPPHQFSPGPAESVEWARKAYEPYRDYFHIPNE